jgi:phosphatidylglycerophosphate synthase
MPGLARLDPNAVTVAVLVPAVLTGVSLANRWWALAALGVVGIMLLATLDGHVAERFGKQSRLGAYLNRLVTEIADAAMLVGLFWIAEPIWVVLVIALTWIVNVAGVLGPTAGGSLQWVGPAAQADRRALLLVAALAAIVWPVDWSVVCALLAMLLLVTAVNRARRSIGELRGA